MNNSNRHKISVYGFNGSIDAMQSSIIKIDKIYIEKDSPAASQKIISELMCKNKFNYEVLSTVDFSKKINSNRSQGILMECTDECYVVLDQVQDPHNLGQILRICASANIDGVVITEHNSVSMTSAVAQVSQGGFSKIPLYSVRNINQCIEFFKSEDFWVTSFENNINSKNWYEIDLKGRVVLIFGGEGNGVSQLVLKNSDFLATIPMSNKMNSLNVSSAVSAVVFERLRQLIS
jgi:23S rRNA (guanosine2251-2'-O)-methyltransferase